ncbi:Osc7112_2153 family protein [Microcoleus sp. Pol7_A1]|uniref:Osc7112_2153 family protein n=1 Tax=Microcoleus TaxID=44471 RepID=UPI001FECBA6A|nr:Osc7112_2153 family protein [Microcoleus asticus]
MKRTVLFSSTILAIITVLELSQASTALPTPSTVKITVNESVETPFDFNQSTWRRCRDRDGGKYPCPRFVMPSDSAE